MNSPTKTEPKPEDGRTSNAIVGIDPTDDELIVLDVWKLMNENPAFKELQKPGSDYITYFLKRQPELKSLAYIEKREYLLSLIVLGWIRDSIYSDMIACGKEWLDKIENTTLRTAMKAIELQSNMLPKVFADSNKGSTEAEIGAKITMEIKKATVKIETDVDSEDSNAVDADYEVVGDDDEQTSG